MRVVFVGRHRILWRQAILYLVTFGIYRRVWLYRVNKEVDGHAALGLNHGLHVFLLFLPVIGPSIVTFQTAQRLNHDLHSEAPIRYGPTWLLWVATLVPILGNLFFILWTQDRLNRYWAHERGNREHGIDVELDLHKDPGFVAELKKAQERSYEAGSRFDRKKDQRRAIRTARRDRWRSIQEERLAVRAAGGSTPVLPWRRPRLEPVRVLHISCGRCEQGFDVTQDPYAETPVLCPRCGLNEVIPALHSNPLVDPEPALVTALQVDCPKCEVTFHTLRNLDRATPIQCYQCGHKDTLPAPRPKQSAATATA